MIKTEKTLLFLLDYLKDEENFVFLWNGKSDNDNLFSYIFTSPLEYILCDKKDDVINVLESIEKFLINGCYVAGFISYEAGFYLDEAMSDISPQKVSEFPLIWFGIYKNPIIYDHKKNSFNNSDINQLFEEYENIEFKNCNINNITSNINKDTYINDIGLVKSAIERGETYQVNYTFKHKFGFAGDIRELFFNLCMKQSASYSAFIGCAEWDILSLSPELFFRRNGNHVIVKPMKGTIKRGINNAEDEQKSDELYNSIKNRAENVMIVDLLRNDIGKMSDIGGVHVSKLYEIEKFQTLFQMTSTVESNLRKNITWLDFFKSVFPSGSVTGAPKIKTMHIINSLEKEPRGVYTGGIGFIAPNNTGVFNVAIRTVVINRNSGNGEMGIGSGIVYDSDAESEFDECLLKANFLTTQYKDFQLIETMLWEKGLFYLLDLHIKRLEDSARYFLFDIDINLMINALRDESTKFLPDKKYKTRLLLFRDGSVTIKSDMIDEQDRSGKYIAFSDIQTDPEDRFLYHKTTNRNLYDDEFRKARSKGYYDFIFINNRGEVTEGAISNIFIQKNGKLYTPPIKCGLLNGTYRQYMLENMDNIEEKILYKKDIIEAERIYLTNSVRGILDVKYLGGIGQ